MTEILISIQPKWVAKILDLSKRWEMRKTIPKAKGPFRVFIYQTEGGGVVGEFVCDSFTEVDPGEITKRILTDTQLTKQEALEYADGKTVYLWRIRSLVDYQEPKPLSAYGLDRPPQSWCYLKGDQE
jgi:predicted transcriptional regulator